MPRTILALTSMLLLAGALATAQVKFTNTFYTDSATGEALGVSSGDFNRDGKPDLAVGTDQGVDIWNNIGSGKFSGPVTYPVGSEAAGQVIAVDINNDGWLDLVVLTFDNTDSTIKSLVTLINNGDGTFRNGTTVSTALPTPEQFAVGDLNRDGRMDLVALTCDFATAKCQFEVLLGSGTGTFSAHQTLALANGGVDGPLLADMNGDGKLDLVNIRNPKVFIWPGTGSGTFSTPISFQPPGDGVGSPVLGDFNNDARLDIAVLQDHCGVNGCDNTSSQTLYVYKNNGSFSFSLASTLTPPGVAGSVLRVVDLNGDQNMDVIISNDNFRFGGYGEYILGKGNFTFGPAYSGAGGGPGDVLTRDFNLDSRHDVAISSQMGGGWTASINTSAFTNCAPPSSANLAAKICGPGANTSVASPVLVKASGNSPAGIQRLEIWVDGVKKYQKWNDQVAKRFSLAAGSHRITVVAVDMYKGTAQSSVAVNVQ